ncbi:MAG: DUF711 family protein [Deltaproteobacteria bacterium]|nr:DUF711 family protein [Deltaproteobacteria bacterium]
MTGSGTIRAFTLGIDPEGRDKRALEERIGLFWRAVGDVVLGEGWTLRSRRIVLPLVNARPRFSLQNLNALVAWLRDVAASSDVRWFDVPFTTFVDGAIEPHFDAALEVVQRYPMAFVNFVVAVGGRIERRGILHAARFIRSVSRLSRNGYDNFRVGATCNGVANTPFFPFSMHDGADGFSVALEQPALMQEVASACKGMDLAATRERLLEALVPSLREVERVALGVERLSGIGYLGTDVSLAPYPDEHGSVARVLETLGAQGYGSSGTLFLTAFLTDVLRAAVGRSGIRTVGFNGVMASLLEDPRIAEHSDLRTLGIDSLISFASVCGCGLDMVPIPGDTYEEEIASIILDVAAMSCALRKPLGVRLLPIPSRRENEFTDFAHDFISNCRIVGVKNRVFDPRSFSGQFEFLTTRV